MIKVCIVCGAEFDDRPVFHTCPDCRRDFEVKMDEMINEGG